MNAAHLDAALDSGSHLVFASRQVSSSIRPRPLRAATQARQPLEWSEQFGKIVLEEP